MTAASEYLPSISVGSVADNVNRALNTIRAHLGMDVAFVSEFVGRQRVFRYVDSSTDTSPIQVGNSGPLEDGYCQRVVDGRLPELIPDTAAVPAAMAIAVTRALPIGAHLSVPIRLSDGRVYGTFCCFSFNPDPSLNERDLKMLRAFAELTAYQIDQDNKSTKEHGERVARIKAVLDEGLLSIVYQPIYELCHGRLAGLECLARFSATPPRSPDEWFSEAAEVGLGVDLETAAMRLSIASLPLVPADAYLAVNLSSRAVLDRVVNFALKEVSLNRLVVEITEHESIAAYQDICEVLDPLRRAGMRVAIDDVGAGYSSMRHILNLRPDFIKLDMSLTRDIDSDPARRALALAMIGFARETGCQIIAEGVETTAELSTLRLLGVRKAQGYLLGRPEPLPTTDLSRSPHWCA